MKSRFDLSKSCDNANVTGEKVFQCNQVNTGYLVQGLNYYVKWYQITKLNEVVKVSECNLNENKKE